MIENPATGAGPGFYAACRYSLISPASRVRVPKTSATWADVWQMATGSIWRSMSVGPVLAWPEVG